MGGGNVCGLCKGHEALRMMELLCELYADILYNSLPNNLLTSVTSGAEPLDETTVWQLPDMEHSARKSTHGSDVGRAMRTPPAA